MYRIINKVAIIIRAYERLKISNYIEDTEVNATIESFF